MAHCTRSSARLQSWQSRYATRRQAAIRLAAYSANSESRRAFDVPNAGIGLFTSPRPGRPPIRLPGNRPYATQFTTGPGCAASPPRLMAGLFPAAAGAEGHLQRHAELERAAHARGHQRAQVVQLTVRHLEDQLVVNLQQHPRGRALLAQ